ncbi:N-acetylglucosamine-6-phosphate deacetylase [Acidisarcina polymorpha]|uniref:N-acetylglucosamine-6-phosphate deacetylase n=1 Tax=Acidisarcina polymorpha TaxID=2211140 RepID=UPI000DEFFCA1|nr:N-acetylglucosamine-6-phosphate deacetylase [Acidisarcina polymorpha]
MKTVFKARKLFSPLETLEQAVVVVEDGMITSLSSQAERDLPADAEIIDFQDGVIAPAYFDQHVHGSGGFDVMEATEEALVGVSRFLGRHGVAGYLATTVTASMDATLKSLSGLARLIEAAQDRVDPGAATALPVGIHLEGPFLSHEKRGVHSPELLLTPTVALFDRFWQAAEGRIRLITIAPELPNAAEVIAHATARGVRVSIGHSNATAEFAQAAIAAGAVSATHTFNAMRQLEHRDPGILGVVLDDGALFAEIICDGHHVMPMVVRLFWKAKGAGRAILITDGISASGMPDGLYKLGNLDVVVKDGQCTSGGSIAGSTLTMDRAVSNFHEFTGAPLAEVAGLAGRNPARMLGLEDRFGSLEVGRRADFVVLGEGGVLRESVLDGRRAK